MAHKALQGDRGVTLDAAMPCMALLLRKFTRQSDQSIDVLDIIQALDKALVGGCKKRRSCGFDAYGYKYKSGIKLTFVHSIRHIKHQLKKNCTDIFEQQGNLMLIQPQTVNEEQKRPFPEGE